MKYLKDVCKIGQGHKTCRYIVAGADGLSCAKLTSMKATIDDRVLTKTFVARADNCEGKEQKIDLSKL